VPPETPDIRIWLIYCVDVLNQPYDTEADWSAAYRIAERLAEAGLSITVHVAEVAPVNVASVLRMPGITRLGHATHAGYHPQGVSMRLRTPWVFPPMTCWALPGMPFARHSLHRHLSRTPLPAAPLARGAGRVPSVPQQPTGAAPSATLAGAGQASQDGGG